ncbi:hypothetical protein MRX96_036968 [Rhipicephalus microplus]
MGVFAQISAIIWKDVYVQLIKRHYFIALGEILLVVLSFTGVENDRPILPPGKCDKLPCLRLSEPTVYEERNLTEFRAPQLILYTPDTPHAKQLMTTAFPSAPPDDRRLSGLPSLGTRLQTPDSRSQAGSRAAHRSHSTSVIRVE